MSQIVLPFNLHNDADADADQVMANYSAITGVVNGSLQAGVNVATGTAREVSSGSAEGSSLNVARADHTHSVQGMERLAAEPTTGNFVGREYFNTTTKQKRLCIALGTPDSWVTGPNLLAADLPTHGIQHADGGGDPLPANSIQENMLRSHNLNVGVPSADVTLTSGAWTDIVTGLAVTVTATQTITLYVNVLLQNTGANSPTCATRVIDGSSAVLFQMGTRQFGASGGSGDSTPIGGCYPINVSASPTLRLQCSSSASGMVARKSQTHVASTFAVTSLVAVVG